jgi:uncharacterized membrane protein YhaH (DUF805 family)
MHTGNPMIDNDSISNLERLHKLKSDGVISEADFETAKQKILEGGRPVTRAESRTPAGAPAADDWLGWTMLPLRKYADFSGRASRKEFWMFGLLITIAMVGCGMLMAIDEYGSIGKLGQALLGLVILATFVPTMAVTTRRFHDQGSTGWLTMMYAIPYLGWIIVLLCMALEGSPGENEFGPKEAL